MGSFNAQNPIWKLGLPFLYLLLGVKTESSYKPHSLKSLPVFQTEVAAELNCLYKIVQKKIVQNCAESAAHVIRCAAAISARLFTKNPEF